MVIKLLSGALGAEIKGLDLKDTSIENFKKINLLLSFLEKKIQILIFSPLASYKGLSVTRAE